MSDNVYPRNGEFFHPSQDAVKEETKRKSETAYELPNIKEALERLNERKAFFESVYSIPDDVKKNPEAFMHLYTAHELVASILAQEIETLELAVRSVTNQ